MVSPDKEPLESLADGDCKTDHDLLIAARQKIVDNTKRIDVHATQIMSLYTAIAGALGIMLLILYQLVLPPIMERIRVIEQVHAKLDNHDDDIENQIKMTNSRIDRLYELYRDLNATQHGGKQQKTIAPFTIPNPPPIVKAAEPK